MRLRLLTLVTLVGASACGPRAGGYRPPEAPPSTLRASAEPGSSGHGPAAPPDAKPLEVGQASWYGLQLAGHPTASGERFEPRQYTAAHRTLAFGTWVEVRRIDTGSTVRVRINDRGPRDPKRVIDLSQKAAEDLGMIKEGVVRVELRIVSGP